MGWFVPLLHVQACKVRINLTVQGSQELHLIQVHVYVGGGQMCNN